MNTLTTAQAAHLAELPLNSLQREYPNYISHLLNSADDARTPRELHPVFFGCMDWHSAVHGYWLLARCAQEWPDLPQAARIAALFETYFQPEPMRAELAYFEARNRVFFERPYGWAWAFALGQALADWKHPRAGAWAATLAPLLALLRTRITAHLQALSYPIRVGTHANTAFALLLTRRFALAQGDAQLREAVEAAAHRYFNADRDYPWRYEPSGADFLSAGLVEALLMSEVLGATEFAAWWRAFNGGAAVPLTPAEVSDRSDPHICHLDGLNLSRAWCLRGLARTLGDATLAANAQAHLAASLPHVTSGHYEGEHWLATFALLALEDPR
jgi:hypothetical protein